MIKKIQQYILIRYPLLWNIRLIPMLLIIAIINLIFFFISYAVTETALERTYYSSYSAQSDLGLIYFAGILVSLLALIGWLTFYFRNNGLKTFYPRTTSKVYLEWFLVFIISAGLSFVPVTLTLGYNAKWRMMASQSEAQEVMNTLETVKMLIPEDADSYKYGTDARGIRQKPIPIPQGMTLKLDSINLDDYSFDYTDKGQIVIKGYTGASMLFYSDYDYNYKDSDYSSYSYDYRYYSDDDSGQAARDAARKRVETKEKLKLWLVQGQKDSIIALMNDFISLQKKHGIQGNLTAEQWYQRINNPPFFPVNRNTRIVAHIVSSDSYDYYDYYDESTENIPLNNKKYYLGYDELNNGYRNIINNYYYDDFIEGLTLFCLCFSIVLSIFIFSFRITTGRSWLLAFVAAGVLLFVTILLSVAIVQAGEYWRGEAGLLIFLIIWLLIFAGILAYLLIKVGSKGNKGYSNVPFNIFMWLVPCICPLVYFIIMCVDELNDSAYYDYSDDVMSMFWFNAGFIIIIMWLVSLFARRWKSLPEE